MKKVDYIVVGLGIAGIAFCEQLRRNKKRFVVYTDARKGATANSGGILNPTNLKYFTAVHRSSEFYPSAVSFYREFAGNSKSFFTHKPIYRIFSETYELNNWLVATDKKRTKEFLSSELIKNHNPAVNAPLGFGEVTTAWQIDVKRLLKNYSENLRANNELIVEEFHYQNLEIKNDTVVYKEFSADKIVFCDGISALQNPLFPGNKLRGNMGEYVIVKAPELKLDKILKGPHYIIPIGEDHYKVGATFNPGMLLAGSTADGIEEILGKLRTMINCDFEIVDQTTGVRPVAADRKPLVGSLTHVTHCGFLNGLGSRGFLMAPMLGEMLFNHLEKNSPVSSEFDINRPVKL